jgi:hypothetical protein
MSERSSTTRSARAPRPARHGRREGWRRVRRGVAAAAAFAVASTGLVVAAASPAAADTVYEITARWADGTPTAEVASGDVVSSEWRVNVNDDAPAPSNEPVDNVTFTTTVTNGRVDSELTTSPPSRTCA